MRKLGLILVLLLSLSVVAAADFTLSGKITPKTSDVSVLDKTHSRAEFTFSNGDVYEESVAIAANGLFTVTLDGAGIESTIAESDTVTMDLDGANIFSGIPLTTVPKATYASKAGVADKLREGNILQLNREGNYDVWIQGSTGSSSPGDERNLALLGVESWTNGNPADRLYVNFNGEYAGGTFIDGVARFLKNVVMDLALQVKGALTVDGDATIGGDLNVNGVITGDGSGITGLVGGNSITKVKDTSTGVKITGDLGVTGTMFGSWSTIGSVPEGTHFEGTATSDGFLAVYLGGSLCEQGSDSRADVSVDNKLTVRLVGYDGATTPVAKGNTWKVEHRADSADSCFAKTYWLPIGASTSSASHGYRFNCC